MDLFISSCHLFESCLYISGLRVNKKVCSKSPYWNFEEKRSFKVFSIDFFCGLAKSRKLLEKASSCVTQIRTTFTLLNGSETDIHVLTVKIHVLLVYPMSKLFSHTYTFLVFLNEKFFEVSFFFVLVKIFCCQESLIL